MGMENSKSALDDTEDRSAEIILNEIRGLEGELELYRRELEKEKSEFGDKFAINYIAYDEDCWPESLRNAHVRYWDLADRIRSLRNELEKFILE